MKNLLRVWVGMVFAASALPALAWGPHGHQLVAEIAARQLEPGPRLAVEGLLGDRADLAMRDASTWPDEVREQPDYRATGPLHYVNFPRGQCHYRARRDCREGRCIVAAINHYVALLADRQASTPTRAEALRFVIHLVGDIHQPLHAAWKDDRGGNDFQVRIGREGRNLHSLWDDTLARLGGLNVREHADQLLQSPMPGARLQWNRQATVAWAEESCRAVVLGVYPASADIDPDYLARMRPIAEGRMELAGRRLAVLLNQVLATGSADRRPKTDN
ncbi:MAG: hypothetical protein COS34_03210 [Lysobacterales bacterium CG02_land_8_20_14_3_00_62_12]|nr:MAG: hypothetical protein COS34_03210 [Xanthomonadales bacterium CG02_land_8_20_14_3_00_62_12]